MIRVLIAEDEPPSARRIQRLIEQADPTFVVVAIAGDGEQALERLAETPCDIVFTDIRMPVMDGLALMDAIRERYPSCLVVVISGYQEFAYLSHAIRAGAADYLLKPVSPQDMTALLVRLHEQHDQQRKRLLSERLSGELHRTEPTRRAPPATRGETLCVCLFCAGAMPLDEDAEMYPGDAAWNHVSPETALREALPSYDGLTWAFMGDAPVERLFLFGPPDGPVDALVCEMHQRMKRRTDIPIACVYTPTAIDVTQVGRTIKRLRGALAASIQIGRSLCMALNPDRAAAMAEASDIDIARALAECVETGALTPDTPLWVDLLRQIDRDGWTQRRVFRLWMDALTIIGAGSYGASIDIPQARRHMTEVIGTALSLKDLSAGLNGLADLAGPSRNRPSAAQQSVAADVAGYLRAHYPEHISLQTLGSAFGYVPSYLSLLFRREYGVSPAEYLTRIRLDAAKRLMQQSPHPLIREIAEQVGFKSQHHFSRVFKKNEGIWPSGYQGDH